jgi:chromosome segregation ATPase
MADQHEVQRDHEQDAVEAHVEAPAQDGERLVPVSEARRYRKRAQAAEAAVEEILADLRTKEEQIEDQQRALDDLRRRQEIDDLLNDAQAVDVETARVLTELTCAEMDEPDLTEAVAAVRRRKPFLFRTAERTSGVLAPEPAGRIPAHEVLDNAAEQAQATGRRQDLLRYLRLRRKA